MTKKPAKKTQQIKPELVLFIADDVIEQSNGKLSLIGFYGDRVVLAQTTEDAPAPTKEMSVAFEGLAFVVGVKGLSGSHQVSLRFDDSVVVGASMVRNDRTHSPGPKLGGSEVEIDFQDVNSMSNILTRLRPFVTTSWGQKTITVTIDGIEYELQFEIRNSIVAASAAQ